MAIYTQTVTRLIDEFAKLPGIGRKTAERLADYILRATEEE
ncbi:MAG: recombination protein RecR, partial [Planctomycetes bacterium]|nr:recombination protein RecR [Planctomycetota bacterium]